MRAFLPIVLLPIVVVFAVAFSSIEVASGQDADRYKKVASQLVELINAGDYAGIQANFNKNMDAALPLDKSSAFFKGLTQQMGKIQKLGEPKPDGGRPIDFCVLLHPSEILKIQGLSIKRRVTWVDGDADIARPQHFGSVQSDEPYEPHEDSDSGAPAIRIEGQA